MIIKSIYLGFNNGKNNKNFKLLMVKLYGTTLKTLNEKVQIKQRNLSPFQNVLNNMNSGQKAFYIFGDLRHKKHKNRLNASKHNNNSIKDEYYYSSLMNKLYDTIHKDNKIPLFRDLKDLINTKTNKCKYNYIIYVGYKDKSDESQNNFPTMLAIYPFKSGFLFHRRSIFGFIRLNSQMGHKIPSFENVSDNKVFQLPFDQYDNIANFYKEGKTFKLDVYSPLIFDNIFHTGGIKKSYAIKTFNRFNGLKTKKPILLTKDNIRVLFVKPNNYKIDDTKKVMIKVFSDKRLLDSMASFTGNGNSIVQQINGDKLYNLLKHLKTAPNTGEKCNFRPENVPDITKKIIKIRKKIKPQKSFKIFVTYKSVPMFCSILRNKLVKQLLTGDVESPFCDPPK